MVFMQPDEAAGFTQKDAAPAGGATAVSDTPVTNIETSEPAHFHLFSAGRPVPFDTELCVCNIVFCSLIDM
jgi:hypothetical protein